MTVVRLPDEISPAFPDKPVAVYFSTKPFDLYGFLKEVSGLDAVILRDDGSLLGNTKSLMPGEDATVGDIVLVNPNHDLQPRSKVEDRPRKNYVIREEMHCHRRES